MSKTALRPRFRYLVKTPKNEIRDAVKARFKEFPEGFTGHALDYHVVIDFPENKRHYWSPQIDFSMDNHEKGTVIRGMVGPRPAVWTSFMFVYIISGVAATGGLVVGLGQFTMGKPPLALWLIPIAALLFGVFYFIGLTGKKIARDETVEIHDFLMSILEDPREISLEEL